MKKLLVCLAMLLFVSPVFADITEQEAKEALKDNGYLYGCTPANWSLVEPIRYGFNGAVMQGRIDIMELEKQAGLDITKCGTSLPSIAIWKNQPEALDFLIKNGYDANGSSPSFTYLNAAIFYKKPESVKVLLDNGANPNLEKKGCYPLNYAIKKKQSEIVKMLLDAGATPNEKTKKLVDKTKNQQIKSYFNN